MLIPFLALLRRDSWKNSFLGSNNILYPKEDREQKVLLYACRNCDHQVLKINIFPSIIYAKIWNYLSKVCQEFIALVLLSVRATACFNPNQVQSCVMD